LAREFGLPNVQNGGSALMQNGEVESVDFYRLN
jgi:hypothetical protein